MMKKKRFVSILLVVMMIFTIIPIAANTGFTNAKSQTTGIYVSSDGTGDGSSIDAPKNFMTAMQEAVDEDAFILVGEMNLPEDWHTPACSITITGADKKTSVLRMAIGGTSETDSASMSLEGNLTLDNLMLDVVENPRPYFSSMFVIVANGNKLVIGKDAYTKSDTSKYMGRIFGGSFHKDVEKDTYIENNGTLLVTHIYGGGCAGDVNGSTNIKVTRSCVNVYGGGLSVYGSTNTANVTGNTNITLQNAQLTSRPVVYGGGDGSYADAIVNGNVTIYHDNVKDGGKTIYGAGNASKGNAYVGGNVSIVVKNYDMANNNSIIYGGGYGSKQETSAGVKGDVNITYENGNFGTVYGAGYKYANVDGETTITLKNNKGTPVVYGGGQGNKTYQVQSYKDVEINLLNSKVDLYTQGVNAKVHGLVSVNLLGGGADRANNSVGYNLYNRMRSSSSNGSDKGEPSEDFKAIVNVLDGDNIVTTINDFENVNIQNGSLLEHVRYYDGSGSSSDGPRELFNSVANVNIEKNACLDLLGDNKIKGEFTSAGNLTTVAGSKLIVDGEVTSSEGASYTSSNAKESYDHSYAFLQTKIHSTAVAQFDSTDKAYFVASRNENLEEGIVRKWYLNKDEPPVINALDKELTVGDTFDPLKDVTATDKEDGDITLTIEDVIENTVDTTKAGTYKVTYRVEDSYGNETTKTIQVIVKNRTYVVDYEFQSGTSDKQLPEEIKKLLPVDNEVYVEGSVVEAKDLTTSEVKDEDGRWIFVGWDEESKVANQNIIFTGTWRFDRNAEVLNFVPTINASDKEIMVGDTFDPLKDVTAADKEDGDITLTIEDVIENTVDTAKAGTYKVTYKVTDSKGASATKTITVTVKDKEVPTIPTDPNDTDDSNAPQSGDHTNTTLWISLLLISGVGVLAAIVYNKKRKNDK